jgi:predicted ATPase/serine phosphatase RsbU (regulator of sigma subunit)/serine/threonine protein kinase
MLSNYQISIQIYDSANSIVYRGIRHSDNQPVILKILKEDYPAPEELARYQQEYDITQSFNVPGIIKAYHIEKNENFLMIIFEDFGGESLKNLLNSTDQTESSTLKVDNNTLAANLTLPLFPHEKFGGIDRFLWLAIQLADTLGQIHAQCVIHKDINPANIVWNQTTDQIKIIDFGISSRLPRENPTLKNPNQLEGTLAYISPEQTGRMNRALDYRTDLYSLGVTFYELLTGQLPFDSEVPLELVHAHLAKIPPPPIQLNPEVPPVISNIIMKLMAKNAEDRYQSAFGLKWDLEQCLTHLQQANHLGNFQLELAQHDFSGRFQIPQTLYGRELEIATLLQAFDRVSQGAGEMMLVAGYSGVGKSALVHEVHKPMTEKQGYFAAGKFDQYQRNIPYLAITQAFNALCDYLLTESDAQLNHWRQIILNAVGPNGQVLIDVIPHLESIIGSQPAVAQVGPSEAQNRFNFVFQNFFRAISQADHPLILFIDDLQWADLASLNLLKILMMDHENGYFLLIGAFRDNEVEPTHPLMLMIDEFVKAQVIVNSISIPNLTFSDVNKLIAESLGCSIIRAQALTQLVYDKTHGNAFFTTEFLHSLYQQELLVFDFKQRQWQWEVSQITALDITDNVVELMVNKINWFPIETIEVLKLAACIGNQFELSILSIISQQTLSQAFAKLSEAIEKGLVLPLDDHYKHPERLKTDELQNSHFKFQHDRVQQAAYSLILQEADRQLLHLQIGRLLLTQKTITESSDILFKLVDHLNIGQPLITDPQEKIELAQLNLQAGKKARNATAYAAARQYLMKGIDCLTEQSWNQHYELTLALYKAQAEVEYLNGHFEQSEVLINLMLEHAQSSFEKANIYNILIIQNTMLAKYAQAIQIGRKALVLLEINLPETNLSTAFENELQAANYNLGNRQIASLIDEPELAIPTYKIAIEVLTNMIPPARLLDIQLFCVITVKIVNISLKHGHVPKSIIGYSCYGLLLAAMLNEYQAAYAFGQLAVKMSDKFNDLSQKCQAHYLLANYLNHWVKPLQLANMINDEGYQVGLQSGELQWSGYIFAYKIVELFYQGRSLDSLVNENIKCLLFSENTKNQVATDIILAFQLILSNLNGLTENKFVFQYQQWNEKYFLEICHQNNSLVAIGNYQILKAQVLYLYGQLEEAFHAILKSVEALAFISGSIFVTEQNFYHSLILTAQYPKIDQQQYWETLKANQQQMKIWADNCPENFLHKYLLVEAEIARISDQPLETTLALYEQAILSAKENEFIQNEALSNELLAKFWLERGHEKIAQIYLKEAHYGYQQWGALAKVNDLEAKYPQWLIKVNRSSSVTQTHLTMTSILNNLRPTNPITSTSSTTLLATESPLDLTTIIKASQAISGEIVLDNLIKTFMQIVLENVGAEQGCLILNQGKAETEESFQLLVEAYATLEQVEILNALPLDALLLENAQGINLSQAIVNYTARTESVVVLNDATHQGAFTHDPYVKQTQPKSVLCFPIAYQNQLYGLFYLENNQTTGAFTEDRLSILTMLSSQIAISLENAQYASHLEEKVARRTAQLAQANEQITRLNEQLTEENLRMRAELDIAKQLQQMVLPKPEELQHIESLDIAGFMEPADEVGGDYYDVLVHEGRIKIGIGDVTGHGLESGVVMLMVQTAVRALLDNGVNDSQQFLTSLNHTIYNNIQRMGTDKNMTLSLLDYQNQQWRITGQHEDILLVHQDGQIELIDTFELGFSVGLKNDIAKFVSQIEMVLQPGEGMVLYTDGITEAQNELEEQYGIERLCQVISRHWHLSVQEIRVAAINEVRQFIGTQKVFDDITLLIIKQK